MPRTTPAAVLPIVMIALTLLAVPAGATIQTYSNRTLWEAATSGVFTIDFNGYAAASLPYCSDYTTGGLKINDVSFTGTGSAGLWAYNPAGGMGSWGSGDFLWGGYFPGYILATLPGTGSTAVGFDVMSYTAGKSVLVTLSSGDSYTVPTYSSPTRAFSGFVSSTPIEWVRFSTSSGYTELDNFSSSSLPVEETPEAQTIFLAGTGLLTLWFARRMRRAC